MDTIQLTSEQSAFFSMIVDKHHEELLFYSVGLCRRYFQKNTLAYDLLQETYLKMCLSFDHVHKGYNDHGVAYLCRMIKNCLFDAERKFKSFDRVEAVFSDRMPKISTIESLCYDIGQERFYHYLDKCLSKRNATIMKYYLEGYKHKEIADLMNLNQNTVSTIISRAKKVLATFFDQN